MHGVIRAKLQGDIRVRKAAIMRNVPIGFDVCLGLLLFWDKCYIQLLMLMLLLLLVLSCTCPHLHRGRLRRSQIFRHRRPSCDPPSYSPTHENHAGRRRAMDVRIDKEQGAVACAMPRTCFAEMSKPFSGQVHKEVAISFCCD